MHFGVLGPVVAWTSDGETVRIPESRVRAILADLIANGPSLSVDRLVDDLWPDRPPRHPERVLRAKMSQLRRALDDAEPGSRELIVSERSSYRLAAPAGSMDASLFRESVRQAGHAADTRTRAGHLSSALELWRGPAFAEFSDSEFARAAATALEEQRRTVVEDQMEARLVLGEHAAMVGELAELVEHHPLRERLRAVQMYALARCGRQDEALRSLENYRSLLAEELGLDPGPHLVAAQRAILRQELPAPPTPTRAPRASTLPHPVGDLLGRRDEADELETLLTRHRLVTLCGAGGVGKTRLAIEAGARVRDAFPDGVFLVELADLDTDSPDLVARRLATDLGVREPSVSDAPGECGTVDWLADTLRGSSMLVLLDNCEHIIDAVAVVAARLLARVPSLHVLATSREPLGLDGEVVSTVAPLSLAELDDTDPEVLRRAGAVELFEARAGAASAFRLTAQNAAAVTTICHRLDGLPLAIELAAGRVRSMGVDEIARRLDERFEVLVSARRDAPPRHATLRATLDWGWGLLDEDERSVLRRIAVHVGGCTAEGAAAVCGQPSDTVGVLSVLTRLVDRSFLSINPGAVGTRYVMAESVGEYCRQRLDLAGETAEVRRRHVSYHRDLVELAGSRIRGREQQQWLARIEEEEANLRAAVSWALADGGREDAIRLGAAAGWSFVVRGNLRDGADLLDQVLLAPHASRATAQARVYRLGLDVLMGREVDLDKAGDDILRLYDDHTLPGEDDSGAERARIQWFLGWLDLAGTEVGSDRLTCALRGADSAGDRWTSAAVRGTQAARSLLRGDVEACARLGERSLAEFREIGDRWGELQALDPLAELAETIGNAERARRLRHEGLRVAEELGLSNEIPFLLTGLAHLAASDGDLDEAEATLERARTLAAGQFHEIGVVYVRMEMALVCRLRGLTDVAREHMAAALAWHRDTGHSPGALHFVLSELGRTAAMEGRYADARRHLRESLEMARATGDHAAEASVVEGIADLASRTGEPQVAAALLGAASAARESCGMPASPLTRADVGATEDRIVALLGVAELAVAKAQGLSSGCADAIRRVLEDEAHADDPPVPHATRR